LKSLIIGYGSIGRRHAAILQKLGHSVSLVTRRKADGFDCYPILQGALDAHAFDYVVISNKTAEHFDSLIDVLSTGFSGPVLVEKPLFETFHPLPELDYSNVFVGYNLRFHPLVEHLRQELQHGIFSLHAYVGQYLPFWRKDSDYRKCYSASRKEGGGVLLDLSHELDYLNWLLGPWRRLAVIGGKYGDLEIESDDVCCMLMEFAGCPAVTLQLNYLDRGGRREIIVNKKGLSFKLDMVNNVLETGARTKTFSIDNDFSYTALHRAIHAGQLEKVCAFNEGLETVNLIDQARRARDRAEWMFNESQI